ncbi:MAG: hypothetical protein IJI32_04450 [Clostridia bacterium]|nr:hypothetical protein [Clostridia bacterium]MBQ6525861.1 hypothetical protein [Clostridia bacterium]
MRTDLLRHGAISLLCLLTSLCILTSCGSKGSGAAGSGPVPSSASDTSSENGSSVTFGDASAATAHFPTFEVAVPADWSVRGNVGKVYEGDGMFLLAGPLDDASDTASVEAALAEELELFFNTEYYRSQVRFEYEKEYEDGAMHRLSGTLHNDRDGGTHRFAGCFRPTPGMYCYYFWPDSSRDRDGERYMETSYESIRIL